jgi:hypothetical protein
MPGQRGARHNLHVLVAVARAVHEERHLRGCFSLEPPPPPLASASVLARSAATTTIFYLR